MSRADGSPTQVARKLTFVEEVELDAPVMATQHSRRFHVRYVTSIRPSEQGDTMRLWIPVPTDDPHQRIRGLEVASPFPYELTSEPKHGNRMVFIEASAPKSAAEVVIEYDVDRSP